MKKTIALLLMLTMLIGCSASTVPEVQMDSRASSQTSEDFSASPVPTEESVTDMTEQSAQSEEASEQLIQAEEPVTVAQQSTYSEAVAKAWEEAGLLDGVVQYFDVDLLDLYGIDPNLCVSCVGYADAVGYTKEIIFVETDTAYAAEVESLLQTHLETVQNQFRSYDPEALKVAENAILLREGGIVLMLITQNADEMLNAFRSVNR